MQQSVQLSDFISYENEFFFHNILIMMVKVVKLVKYGEDKNHSRIAIICDCNHLA